VSAAFLEVSHAVRAAAALAALLVTLAPAAAEGHAKSRPILLGVLGGRARFDRLTGQQTRVGHVIAAWGQGPVTQILAALGEMPMLGITTGGSMTPRDIAFGAGDGFLGEVNRAAAAHAGPVFIRPLPEMNGHWNPYCAYNSNGSSRGPAYSTQMFRKAFARIYVLVHGGSVDVVDAALRRLGLPPSRAGDLSTDPPAHVQVMWNPQGYGSPDLPGNSAAAYYPGDAYVDVVADDIYNIHGRYAWAANEQLYAAHPGRPYAIAEWANWGLDDPAFVARIAQFARTHSRVELLAYYNGRPGSPFDIASQPRSRAAYRQLIDPLGD